MDFSGFAIRIIFLLLPGAVGAMLYWKLKGRTTRKDWEDFLEVIVFSLISYLFYGLLTHVLCYLNFLLVRIHLQAKTFTQFRAFIDEKIPLDLWEIFYVLMLSIVLAVVASYSYRYTWLTRLAQKIGATARLSDDDVWSYFHFSAAMAGNWTTVKDHKLNISYFCWIEYCSDSEKERELILRDVQVLDAAGNCLYKTDVMYLARKHDDLSIERCKLKKIEDLEVDERDA